MIPAPWCAHDDVAHMKEWLPERDPPNSITCVAGPAMMFCADSRLAVSFKCDVFVAHCDDQPAFYICVYVHRLMWLAVKAISDLNACVFIAIERSLYALLL